MINYNYSSGQQTKASMINDLELFKMKCENCGKEIEEGDYNMANDENGKLVTLCSPCMLELGTFVTMEEFVKLQKDDSYKKIPYLAIRG